MKVFLELKDSGFLPSWAAGEEKEEVKDDAVDPGISKLADVLEKRLGGKQDPGKEGKKYLDILR